MIVVGFFVHNALKMIMIKKMNNKIEYIFQKCYDKLQEGKCILTVLNKNSIVFDLLAVLCALFTKEEERLYAIKWMPADEKNVLVNIGYTRALLDVMQQIFEQTILRFNPDIVRDFDKYGFDNIYTQIRLFKKLCTQMADLVEHNFETLKLNYIIER